jgi:hypothetical protein
MGDTWWVIIICPCVTVFSLMGGVTEADVGFPTGLVVFYREINKQFSGCGYFICESNHQQ